jgi:asparagine synthase (glutamine-hydrolysing)
MCGITGIVDFTAQSSISESLLRKMTDVIAHRGPDDEGQWVSHNRQCGLGFRRLSIVDLSAAGHQPMITPDGRFTIVFNGEIYNHERLRPDLEKKGISLSFPHRHRNHIIWLSRIWSAISSCDDWYVGFGNMG